MEWLFVVGLLLFIAFIPLRNYLSGYKRKQGQLRKIYKNESGTQDHSGHKNHSGHSCC